MEHIKQIRNRINKKETKNKVLRILSTLMLFLSIILGLMIYMKKDENGEFLAKNFGINMNFKNFNSKTEQIMNNLFKFEFEKKNDDLLVSQEVNYIHLGDNLYNTDDNSIKMIEEGIILGVYESENNKTILVSYNNGILASYSSLEDILVKQYDQLEKGDSFASYSESFKVIFKKDNKIVNYEEAFK